MPKYFRFHESYAMVASVLTSPRPLSLRRSSARRRYPQHTAPLWLLVQATDTKYQIRMKMGVMGELARTTGVFF